MKDLAELLQAIGSLLWPALAFVFAWHFRHEFRELLRGLKRAKVLGQEVELERSLDQLNKSATAAVSEIPSTPTISKLELVSSSATESDTNDPIRKILEITSSSAKAGLVLLTSEIESELRKLMAAMGHLGRHQNVPLPTAIQFFDKQGSLPKNTADSVRNFYQVRNQIVHGHTASSNEVLRAIDSGITILKALKAIPHEINIVHHPGVEVFSDHECKQLREGVHGVILETTSPGGILKFFRIFPTTRTHFKKGERVTWEWNMDPTAQWEESWYRDPDTKEIKYAWTGSLEFIGRHLVDV